MRRPTRLAVLAAVVCFPVAPAAGQAKTRGEPRLAPDVAQALEDLKATSPTLRQAAARTLGKVERPAPEPVLRGLCAALVDSPKETRIVVLAALGELAPELAKPLGEINAARGPDWLKRHQRDVVRAVEALADEGPAAAPAEPFLRDLLRQAVVAPEPWLDRAGVGGYSTSTVTGACLRAFRRMPARDVASFECVAGLAGQRLPKMPPPVRQDALECLRDLVLDRRAEDKARTWLTDRLVILCARAIDRDADCRLTAVRTAAHLGPKAADLLPKLERLTRSTDQDVRDAAKEAVKRLSEKD